MIASFDEEVRSAQHFTDVNVGNAVIYFDAHIVRRGITCPVLLAVAERESDQFLGTFHIQNILPGVKAELGWSLGPDGRGRGLSEEALQLALDHLHKHVKIPTVIMGTATDNVRARRQIAAVGAAVVERRDYQAPNGDVIRSVWFAHTM